jgi:predicted  nucleic acid-binding Zn-ribbon protein
MLKWKRTAVQLNEELDRLWKQNVELKRTVDEKTAENAHISGMLDAALEEQERLKAECRELAKQCGAALKELELKMSVPHMGADSRDAQWENMMNYTGEKQEVGE